MVGFKINRERDLPLRFAMSEAWKAAGRQALATAGTALVIGTLHVPQPFLAVLAAQVTAGICFSNAGGFSHRLAGVWIGTFVGAILFAIAPEQPWISLPLFGLAATFGPKIFHQRGGPSSAVLFLMALAGMFVAGGVDPRLGLISGMAHAISLTVAVMMTFLVSRLFPVGEGTPPRFSGGWVGISGILALIVSRATMPDSAIVATIAGMTMAFSLSPEAPPVLAKLVGGVLGVLISGGFIVVVAGSGNDLGVFLGGLGLSLGAFEWCAITFKKYGVGIRQAAAIFSSAVTMLPRPVDSIGSSGQRMSAVILGLVIGGLVAVVSRSWRPEVKVAMEPTVRGS